MAGGGPHRGIRRLGFSSALRSQVEVLQLPRLLAGHRETLITPHRTDFYHMFLFAECHPVHLVDFTPVQIEPYSLLFIDKGCVHQFDGRQPYAGDLLVFTDDLFCITEADARFLHGCRLFNDLKGDHLVHVDEGRFRTFSHICRAITDELAVDDPRTSPVILKNLTHNLLLLALREKTGRTGTPRMVGADQERTGLFKDLLEKGFVRHKDVAFYAREMHISEKQLGQATIRLTGRSPKQLIHDRVLLEARRSLVHGGQTVKEIAYALGFAEPTNFIKYFKKHLGSTPLEFRAEHAVDL